MSRNRSFKNKPFYSKIFLLIAFLTLPVLVFNGCSKAKEEKAASQKTSHKTPDDLAREHFNKGVKLSIMGKYDEAIEEYKKTIKLNPTSAEAYNNIGFAYLDKGDVDNAIKSQKKAIETNKNLANGYYGLALAFEKKGDKKEALKNWNEYIKRVDPKSRWYAKAKERIKTLKGKK